MLAANVLTLSDQLARLVPSRLIMLSDPMVLRL